MTPTNSTTPAYQHGVYPDARGRYGDFGGRFVPESLMAALAEAQVVHAPGSRHLSGRNDPRGMAGISGHL